MDITRRSILGVGSDTSLVGLDWLRPNTPYTKDGKEKMIDCVEFEISHKGIDKLERHINNKTEYIMCFVHFEAGTQKLDNIYLSVWDEEEPKEIPIDVNILTNEEKEMLTEYALEEIQKMKE